ncbi:MAG TPA: hypothetical protein VFE58_03010 [Tepidisphaeraceae bacterium]|jgi:hypothetical protein|nr:hypothetical protein [Tepidisphaeraceae bacterium]
MPEVEGRGGEPTAAGSATTVRRPSAGGVLNEGGDERVAYCVYCVDS